MQPQDETSALDARAETRNAGTNELRISMRTYFLLILCAITATLVSTSRADDPNAHPSADVKAFLNTSAVHPGDKATLAVQVMVHQGLHAQSRTPLDDDYVRFDLKLKPADQPDVTLRTGWNILPVKFETIPTSESSASMRALSFSTSRSRSAQTRNRAV